MNPLLRHETRILLPSHSGQLETALGIPPSLNETTIRAYAVIAHPHPLYGGTMFNKIVTTLVKMYAERDMATVRFNFRGVGQSSGHYSDGDGEYDDLCTAIEFANEKFPSSDLYLAGFSFGAYIATKAASHYPVKHLISIAPPVVHFPVEALHEPGCPWIIAQGEEDEVVPASAVHAYALQCKNQPLWLSFPDTTHFFHGKLVALQERLSAAMTKQLG